MNWRGAKKLGNWHRIAKFILYFSRVGGYESEGGGGVGRVVEPVRCLHAYDGAVPICVFPHHEEPSLHPSVSHSPWLER